MSRDLSLVHTKAPEREKLDVGIDIALIKFLLSVVRVDVRLPGRPCGKDEREGVGGVRGEDRVAEERGGDEARECCKVGGAIANSGDAAAGGGNITSAGNDVVAVAVGGIVASSASAATAVLDAVGRNAVVVLGSVTTVGGNAVAVNIGRGGWGGWRGR